MAPTRTIYLRNDYRIPGVVKLLFETPSGFAIFSFDQKYLKKSIEILWLHEFRKFEDKPNVINLTAQPRILPSASGCLAIPSTACPAAVPWPTPGPIEASPTANPAAITEAAAISRFMGLKCLYDDAVGEVMWGLQNLMHTLVPQEQSKLTKDDRLPMSIGLNMVLNRHKVYIKPGMLNECIIKKTSKVYATDLSEKAHMKFLHKRFDEDFKVFSKVDSKVWSLFKLATALKIMFDPQGGLRVGNPHKMFSNDELTAIRRDAHLYQQTLDKDLVLAVYDDVVTLREDKAELLYELRTLVQEAKEGLETEEVQDKPATNGVDSKRQVGAHV